MDARGKVKGEDFSKSDRKITKLVQILEVLIVIPAILVILGIFLVPTILYALPSDSPSSPPTVSVYSCNNSCQPAATLSCHCPRE